MRKLVLLFLISTISIAKPNYNDGDKQAHFIAGYAISLGTAYVLKKTIPEKIPPFPRAVYGFVAAMFAGFFYEQLQGARFDGNDVLATSVGGAFGAASVVVIDF